MRREKLLANNLNATDEQLADDLNGVLTSLQRKMLRVMLKHIDELAEHIVQLDDDIDRHMKDEEKIAAAQIQELPGIGNTSAETIISVIGADMSRFPTDKYISKWAGLCPGNTRKRKSGRTTKGNALLRSTLVVCAHSAVKNKNSYFYAVNANLKLSIVAGTKCNLSPVSTEAYTVLMHNTTCRLGERSRVGIGKSTSRRKATVVLN